ncbi:MAG TPA: hypothetical protein VFF16_07355, partial [Telluria sp.]|nr:hypothetical protein [Telluria sp.]
MKPHVRTALAAAFLIAFSLGAAAQDAPGQAGRISLIEGRVDLGGLAEPGPAMLNFPVTSGMELTTQRGARTELRVGSTAVRLDGDSSLEVTQLDDDHFRLRLYYGSVSVRVRDRAVAADFSLETPQG